MRSVRKKVMWVAGVVLLVLIGGFAWGRLRPPSAAQAQALALLQQDHRPSQGHNAWATFWLLNYDIPADSIDRAYAQERQHLIEWVGRLDPDKALTLSYNTLAAKTYPRRPTLGKAEQDLLCRHVDADCLGKLRGQASSPRQVLARQAARLTRMRSIAATDYLWDDTPPSPYIPLPAFGLYGDLQRTAAALDFVEGRRQQGLAETCRHAQTVRQLHAHTNSMIGAMIATSWMDAAEQLFAGMLAELPADQAVPAICAQAFAPVVSADIDLCAPMQREFAWAMAAVTSVDPARAKRPKQYARYLWMDKQGLRRMMAPRYAWACRADVRKTMLADHALTHAQVPRVHYDFFDGVSNAVGVILARVAPPDYAQYMNRNEDFAAGLRLTGLLLQARRAAIPQDALPGYLQQHFAATPRGATRTLRVDPDGRHVRMSLHAPRRGHQELLLSIAP